MNSESISTSRSEASDDDLADPLLRDSITAPQHQRTSAFVSEAHSLLHLLLLSLRNI